MSTKAIRELVLTAKSAWRGSPPLEAIADKAMAEVEAIERAARSICENGGREALHHANYGESVDLLESIAKEAP